MSAVPEDEREHEHEYTWIETGEDWRGPTYRRGRRQCCPWPLPEDDETGTYHPRCDSDAPRGA